MECTEKKEQKRNTYTAKKFLLISAAFGLLALVVACTAPESKEKEEADRSVATADIAADVENPATENPTAENPAIGLRLMPEEFPRVDASAQAMSFSETIAAAVMDMPLEEARLYILHNEISDAYMNLIDGRADIIFAASPSETELLYAKEQNVELRLTPILYSAFVFFVNAKNPVDGVNLADIVGIYSDKVKNWNEIGGIDAEIRAYRRPANSADQTAMQKLVMKETPMAETPAEGVYKDMSDIVSAVASYDYAEFAIGYSYYDYAMNAQSTGKIKYLNIDGVAPDEMSISNGDYPLVSTIYMALRQDEPADSVASRLAEWVMSAEGQAVAEKGGCFIIR
jgi:phosphate transport system substrate-binding protein